MKRHIYFRMILGCIVLALLLIQLHQPVVVLSSTDGSSPINDVAMKLVQFCIEPKVGLDEHAVATLVDYVLDSKRNRAYALNHKGRQVLVSVSKQISKSKGGEQVPFADTPKEQMVEELMLEYLKITLGKPTLFGKQFFLPANI